MNGIPEYIMAFDLGSSRIVAGLAIKLEHGGLRILAVEQRPVDSDIRHGVVHNIEEVALKIKEIKEALCQSQSPELVVSHVYASINGYTIRTKNAQIESNYGGTTIFTEKELDELADQIPEYIPEGFTMVNCYQQEFLVDGTLDKNPVGAMPKHVKAHYKLVGGREDVVTKTEAAFQSIKLSAFTHLGPVASAEAVLTPEEKFKGVVCLDFGAETTSITIYKGDLIRYVSVLPFGGRNITLDLLQLNMDEDDAEQIKLIQGDALHYTGKVLREGEEPITKEFQEINDIIVARIEETVENIWVQINRSGIEPTKLLSGIVVTGGASRLPNLEKLIAHKTGMNVRAGLPNVQLEPDSANRYGKLELSRCIGLLLLGKNGCFHKELEVAPKVDVAILPPVEQTFYGFPPEKPTTKKPPKVKKIKEPKVKKKGSSFRDIFTNITDFLNEEK